MPWRIIRILDRISSKGWKAVYTDEQANVYSRSIVTWALLEYNQEIVITGLVRGDLPDSYLVPANEIIFFVCLKEPDYSMNMCAEDCQAFVDQMILLRQKSQTN